MSVLTGLFLLACSFGVIQWVFKKLSDGTTNRKNSG